MSANSSTWYQTQFVLFGLLLVLKAKAASKLVSASMDRFLDWMVERHASREKQKG